MENPAAGILQHGKACLEYFVFGEGHETMFLFHGFDNDAKDLFVFREVLSKRYRCVAVNLFFHGRSTWDEPAADSMFTADELYRLMRGLMDRFPSERYSWLGFSLGGRIILQLTEEFAAVTDRIILLAPDGLHMSFWYRFLTSNPLGRSVFTRAVKDPTRFLNIAGWLRRLGIAGERQYRFALANFDTAEKRKKVYEVWMVFRHLLPDLSTVAAAIDRHRIRTDLIFGKYDRIIPPSAGKELCKKGGTQVTLHVVDNGHNLVKEKTAEELKKILAE